MNFSAGLSGIDSLSFLSDSLWSHSSSLKLWVGVSRRLRSSSTFEMVTPRACTDQLSRNFTNILQMIEEYQRIISRFRTNWTHHKSKSWSNYRKLDFSRISFVCLIAWFAWAGLIRLRVLPDMSGKGCLIFLSMIFYPTQKNPAYGRQRISRPMRIVGPIQFWRGCVIYIIFYFFYFFICL